MQLIKIHSLALCLVAISAACAVTDGDTDTDAGTSSTTASTTASTTDSTTASTTDSTTASTSDSTTASTTDSTTDSTTASTTDSTSGSTGESETDASTGVVDTTGDTGTGGGVCGWVEKSSFYDCGGDGPDPDGKFPIECPEFEVGAECDANSEINGTGCCTATSAVFCGDQGTIEEVPC